MSNWPDNVFLNEAVKNNESPLFLNEGETSVAVSYSCVSETSKNKVVRRNYVIRSKNKANDVIVWEKIEGAFDIQIGVQNLLFCNAVCGRISYREGNTRFVALMCCNVFVNGAGNMANPNFPTKDMLQEKKKIDVCKILKGGDIQFHTLFSNFVKL